MKHKTFRSAQLLSLARGQECVMCGANDDTIVSAHSNLMEHGKGMGMKAHDGMVSWLCHHCHSNLDQGRGSSKEDKRTYILTAICRTYMKMWDLNLLKVRKPK